MGVIYEHHLRVVADDIDELGHVGNVRYLAWLMDAATAHSAACGWDWPRYREQGAAFVVRRHELDYLRPAFADDELVVRTWISSMARASSVRSYEILRGEVVLMRAATNWVFMNLSTGSPTRIPEQLVRDFEFAPKPAPKPDP